MASPWKLLARLVSPRRKQRQDQSSTDEAKPDAEVNFEDSRVDEKPASHGQSEAVSAAQDHSDETAGVDNGTAAIEGAGPEQAADPALSDNAGTVARDASKPLQTGEGRARKRSRRGKKAEPVEVDAPPSRGVPIVSDDAVSLDEEIRVLRDQLARKLQLQNAQLKKMLERFQR